MDLHLWRRFTLMSSRAIRIAIVNDYELVVRGLAAVLAPYADRIEVVELDSGLPVVSDVDVLLYDTFGQAQGDTLDHEELVRDSPARLVVFSWNTEPDLVDKAVSRGANGYLSKSISAAELVAGIEAVHAGETVTPEPIDADEAAASDLQLNEAWPGRDLGLSAREAEVVALITQGLSNQEIADRCFLSINSVKTYVRTAYRKMGVNRRSQAVLWGLAHGFTPDHTRDLHPDG